MSSLFWLNYVVGWQSRSSLTGLLQKKNMALLSKIIGKKKTTQYFELNSTGYTNKVKNYSLQKY